MPVFQHQYADGLSRSLIALGLGASVIGTTYHTYLLAALFSPAHPKKGKRLRNAYKTGGLYMPLASVLAVIGFFGAAIRMGQSDFIVRRKPTVFCAGALALFGMNPWTALVGSKKDQEVEEEMKEGVTARIVISALSLVSGLVAWTDARVISR